MERQALIEALAEQTAPYEECAQALREGAEYRVWDESTPTHDLIRTYRRRAAHVAEQGLRHEGFEEALQRLDECPYPELRLGKVEGVPPRHYQLFFAPHRDEVVACLWVEPPPG